MNAFFSVHGSQKNQALIDFARALQEKGVGIYASGGTMRFLVQKGELNVVDFADTLQQSFVAQCQTAGILRTDINARRAMEMMREAGLDFGEVLEHQVVTISRELAIMLLCSDNPEHMALREKMGLPKIDLLYCYFYPLVEAIAAGATIEEVIKQTDIGGPLMIRLAAKGGRIVICDPADLSWVQEKIQADGDLDLASRQHLRGKAESVVSQYSAASGLFHLTHLTT